MFSIILKYQIYSVSHKINNTIIDGLINLDNDKINNKKKRSRFFVLCRGNLLLDLKVQPFSTIIHDAEKLPKCPCQSQVKSFCHLLQLSSHGIS